MGFLGSVLELSRFPTGSVPRCLSLTQGESRAQPAPGAAEVALGGGQATRPGLFGDTEVCPVPAPPATLPGFGWVCAGGGSAPSVYPPADFWLFPRSCSPGLLRAWGADEDAVGELGMSCDSPGNPSRPSQAHQGVEVTLNQGCHIRGKGCDSSRDVPRDGTASVSAKAAGPEIWDPLIPGFGKC